MQKSIGKRLIYDADNTLSGVEYRDLKLCVEKNSKVDTLVKQYHYSHKSTRNRMLSMVVYVQGSLEIAGFIQLGYGIRPNLKQHIYKNIQKGNFCEFDRMWLSDDLPKYSETIVISMLLYFIKYWNPNIKYIITYADGSVGNTGVIYRASNAVFIGKHEVDFYILPNGERVHPVSMWHRHKTRKRDVLNVLYPGINHVQDEYQYRYLYILDKKEKKQFLKNLTS